MTTGFKAFYAYLLSMTYALQLQ